MLEIENALFIEHAQVVSHYETLFGSRMVCLCACHFDLKLWDIVLCLIEDSELK